MRIIIDTKADPKTTLRRPQNRLRVGDVRVFYDVGESQVEVLAIVSKEGAEKWLGDAARRG